MSISPASPPPSNPAKPPLTGIGILCLILGLLLAIPSGACAGIIVIGSLADTLTGGHIEDALSLILMGFLFAVIPLAGGILLVAVGLRLRKPSA
ncbi:hypothetical protein [Desertibaculum subflavum]|uniref:hypothetical protein n=1 Tax=Desertibaculum subflavum TaxID=2268458 RepID=UPI000E66B447